MPWDNNASPARYIATVESVTAEIRFTRNPTPDQLSNDYAELNNISQLVLLNSYVKEAPQTSDLFYNTVFKIDDTKSFSRIDIIFQRGICGIFVEYNIYLFAKRQTPLYRHPVKRPKLKQYDSLAEA